MFAMRRLFQSLCVLGALMTTPFPAPAAESPLTQEVHELRRDLQMQTKKIEALTQQIAELSRSVRESTAARPARPPPRGLGSRTPLRPRTSAARAGGRFTSSPSFGTTRRWKCSSSSSQATCLTWSATLRSCERRCVPVWRRGGGDVPAAAVSVAGTAAVLGGGGGCGSSWRG